MTVLHCRVHQSVGGVAAIACVSVLCPFCCFVFKDAPVRSLCSSLSLPLYGGPIRLPPSHHHHLLLLLLLLLLCLTSLLLRLSRGMKSVTCSRLCGSSPNPTQCCPQPRTRHWRWHPTCRRCVERTHSFLKLWWRKTVRSFVPHCRHVVLFERLPPPPFLSLSL